MGLTPESLLFGGSPTFYNGGQNQKRPTNGRFGIMTPSMGERGFPTLQSGGQKRERPTNGPSGDITLAVPGAPMDWLLSKGPQGPREVLGVPNTSKRRTK